MTCYGVEEVLAVVLLAVLPGSAIANLGLQVARKKLGVREQREAP
ncbi:hypothetical protein [Halorarius litoreus]|nr:hypothetical protein [Halorarius litoreus]